MFESKSYKQLSSQEKEKVMGYFKNPKDAKHANYEHDVISEILKNDDGSITIFAKSGIGWDFDSNKIPKVNVGDNIITCTYSYPVHFSIFGINDYTESFPIFDIKEC